jgi:hypothetical protein
MTQFDPSMVAQMLMQPIQRASENLGGAPFGIGADAGGSYFVNPEVAARTGYGTAVTGTSFFPGAGIVDAAGGAVDITGQPLPSFGENIRQGNYLDAALQGLGVAGDVATVAAPATLGASAVLGAMLKAPRAAQKIGKATDVASDVAGIAKVEPQSLPLDKTSRLERAKDLGFDVDNPIYHGTNTDELTFFDESKIGSRDEGFFGRGFYFADNPGEAGFYGKNVGEYFVRGDLLDLTNTSGDFTLDGPKKFIDWAEKLDKIDMLDDTHKQALNSAKKLVKYVDENIEYNIGQNADGTEGVFAKIVNPTLDTYGKGEPEYVSVRLNFDGTFPKTKEEAKERLLAQFSDEMKRSTYKDIDFFEGYNNDFLFSLSDYIREGGDVSGLNASKLTEKAKAAGFDGIRAGDETVIFDAKNIRSSDAAFDPEKTDSPQLLSSVMQDSMTAVA